MSGWKAKRFWKEAKAVEVEGGWTVQLDARVVKTPAKSPLTVPTRSLAEAIAAEWDAQQGEVKPDTMPVTRAANSAIDKVAPQYDAVVRMLADYAGTDLLSYRATDPAGLIARQAEAWDPLLDWADQRYGARLSITSGVIPVTQDQAALERLHAALHEQGVWRVTALHDLIAISGSFVIGMALGEKAIDLDAGWRASRIDEHWQVEQWGRDEEAEELEEIKRQAMKNALRFLDLASA